MRAGMMGLLALLSAAGQETPVERSLTLLRPVAKRLDDGIQRFLAGAKPAEAFKPFHPESVPIDRSTVLRGELKTHAVVAAETFAVGLDIQLWSAGKGVYRVTVLAHVTPTEASIIELDGRPFDSSAPEAVPLAKCAGESEPAGDAAEFFIKRLKERRDSDLVFISAPRLARRIPKRFQEVFEKKVKHAQSTAAEVCKAVADAAYDEIRVQFTDQSFTSLGADGTVRDGFILGKLRISDVGDVLYRLNRFETE